VIPRVFHRIWLGTDPMPEEFVRWGETWAEHHPDWTMELWTEDHLPELRDRAAFDRGRNHSERSNVLRYELLFHHGGVYIDTDMECLRSIEPLLDGVEAFAGYTRPGSLGSAIIGAAPGHPAFDRAAELVNARVATGERQWAATGPGFLTEILADFPDVTLFEPKYFYPFRWDQKHLRHQDFPDAYAIHHWTKTWETYDELRDRVERLQRKLGDAEARFQRAKRSRDKKAARLKAIQRSPWWRLGRLGAAGVGAVRSRVRRDR
jgi:mannosyltransferase OCH1-like enzyme